MKIETLAGRGINEMEIWGRYEFRGDHWRLVAFRVGFKLPVSSTRTESEWQKVSKRQRKNIGCLKLTLWTRPEGEVVDDSVTRM